MKPIAFLSTLTFTLSSWFAEKAFAQGGFFSTEKATGIVVTSAAQGSLGDAVVTIINYFLGILGLVAVAYIIYGGVLMVTSAGEEEGVTKAKKIVTYAAVGFVLIIISYSIVTFVANSLGG